MDVAHKAPLSIGFSRQEYWSGLPCSVPGHFSDPEIKPMSPALSGGFFTAEPQGKPNIVVGFLKKSYYEITYNHVCEAFENC